MTSRTPCTAASPPTVLAVDEAGWSAPARSTPCFAWPPRRTPRCTGRRRPATAGDRAGGAARPARAAAGKRAAREPAAAPRRERDALMVGTVLLSPRHRAERSVPPDHRPRRSRQEMDPAPLSTTSLSCTGARGARWRARGRAGCCWWIRGWRRRAADPGCHAEPGGELLACLTRSLRLRRARISGGRASPSRPPWPGRPQ